jgi:hypothetical protein
MTDYMINTGSTGKMLIRDQAPGAASGNIEFWITSNNSTTFDHEMPWAWTVNGIYSGPLTHNYNANSGWNLLGVWTVSASQTVQFYLGATGTSGLGGPTTFNQYIARATVPDAPNTPTFSSILFQTADVLWTPNGNGGAAIDNYEVAYGVTSGAPSSFPTSATSPLGLTGLVPGTTYYAKVRAHNSVGWSGYSAEASFQTIAGSRIKVAGVYVNAIAYVKDGGVWKFSRPYVKDAGTWKTAI